MAEPALQLHPFTPPSLAIGRIQLITSTQSSCFIKTIRSNILPRILAKADLDRLNEAHENDFGNLIAARRKLMRAPHWFGPVSTCHNMLMLFEATRLSASEALDLYATGTTVGLFSIQANHSSSTDTLRGYEQADGAADLDEPISDSKAKATFHAFIYTPYGCYEVTVSDITEEFKHPSATIVWRDLKDGLVHVLDGLIPLAFTTDYGRGYEGD